MCTLCSSPAQIELVDGPPRDLQTFGDLGEGEQIRLGHETHSWGTDAITAAWCRLPGPVGCLSGLVATGLRMRFS